MNVTGAHNESLVRQFIREHLGPQRLPLTVVVPMTLVYAVIFVTGVLGNLSVCLVITKTKALHTSTNYYLFSLAVSDLSLLLLGLPYDVSLYWQQYPWPLGTALCKCRALVSEMASYTSVLTIVAFSMERYLAICHPLLSYSMSGLQRAVKLITVLWVLSLLAASPFAIYTKINYLEYPEDSGNYLYETAFCAMLRNNLPKGIPIYEMSFVIFFLLPMVMIIILYTLIGRKIQSRGAELSDNVTGSVHRDARHLRSRRNIVRMLTAVVITFFACWFPFHAQRLFYLHGEKFEFYALLNEWAFYITGVLYYLSATMNPILYNLMSVKYRTAFRQTLTCGCGSCDRTNHGKSMKDTLTLRSSSFRASVVRTKKGCPTALYPVGCESNNYHKDCYTAVPTAPLEIQQTRPSIKNGSLSYTSEGEDYDHIKQAGSDFDRHNSTSI